MQLPKLNFLYYKNLLDSCFTRFCEDYNNDFTKDGESFVYTNRKSKLQLKNIFRKYFTEELKKYIKPYSVFEPNYYFIIGSCLPKDNYLLNFKDGYFPQKLDKLLASKYQIRYVLKEKDIKIDLLQFNAVFEEVFDDFFRNRNKIFKYIGSEYKNLFMIQHKQLDCLTLYRTCKLIYGKSNTVNLYKKYFQDNRVNIHSINESIDRYIHAKVSLNQSDEFKLIVSEVKQYISECIKFVNNG